MSLRGPDRSLHDGSERASYPDRSEDDTTGAFDTIADALAGVRTCRECGCAFATRVPSASNKWTDCCGPCLRAMGCL